MKLINGIHSRRSIRNYTDQEISKKDLEEIITAGMAAPSAKNQQAREFFIIENKETLQRLSEEIPFGRALPKANKAIITCFNTKNLLFSEYIQQDLGACTQNILLVAHAKGLWGVRIWIYPKENLNKEINKKLNIPDHLEIFNIISLGYPDTTKPLREKEYIQLEKIHRL